MSECRAIRSLNELRSAGVSTPEASSENTKSRNYGRFAGIVGPTKMLKAFRRSVKFSNALKLLK